MASMRPFSWSSKLPGSNTALCMAFHLTSAPCLGYSLTPKLRLRWLPPPPRPLSSRRCQSVKVEHSLLV
eukprot:14703355-Alexandrium_andersonii.AAC.1